MPYTVVGRNVMLTQLARLATHVSLHSSVPNEANELGERQRVTWNTAADGAIKLRAPVRIRVPRNVTVTHGAFWNAAQGGFMFAWGPVEAAEFVYPGTYVIDVGMLDLNIGA